MKLLLLSAFVILLVAARPDVLPTIGVLTHPSTEVLEQYGPNYLSASYVKWTEMAGARAVPILWDAPTSQIFDLMSKIDGILFPGGSRLKNLFEVSCEIYREAIRINKAGRPFVLFGTCLGFEQLGWCEGAELEAFDTRNIAMNLDFTKEAFSSRTLQGMPQKLIYSLQNENITMNNHYWGFSLAEFNRVLAKHYVLISTNKDRQGKVFVSTMEHKLYPFFGVQWHPEKPIYEHSGAQANPHTQNAVAAGKYFAEKFIEYARKADGSITPEEVERRSFNRLNPVYTFPIYPYFSQVYFFESMEF
ncbi:hypothetical protein RCL1_008684 [Eukaryota sp. TZLM3-RCL]